MPFKKFNVSRRFEQIIPWLYFVAMPFLLFVVLMGLYLSNNTNTSLKGLAIQNNELLQHTNNLEKENNDLSKQNKDLSEQNQRYQHCNFLAFAHFTQNRQPVQDDEIDSCIIDSAKASASSSSATTSSSGQAHGGTGQSVPASASSNTTTPNTPSQPDNSHTQSSQPVKILDIPVCLPLTKVCLTQ